MDISWTELLVVAVVAIIVVGPKELPGMLRSVGRMFGQVRRTAREFQNTFNDALREAERQAKLDDVRKELDEVRRIDPAKDLRSTVSTAQKDLDAAVAKAAPAAGTVPTGAPGVAGTGAAMPSGAPATATAEPTAAPAAGQPASPAPAPRPAAVVPAAEPAAAAHETVTADGTEAPRLAVGDRR